MCQNIWKIVAKLKSFIDSEFIRECLKSAAKVLYPEKKKLFSKVSLARQWQEELKLVKNIENTLKVKAFKFIYYLIILDESTDICEQINFY